MSFGFVVTKDGITPMLNAMVGDPAKNVKRRSIKKAAGILARATKSEMRGIGLRNMQGAVRVSSWRNGEGASIHIMGKNKKVDGSLSRTERRKVKGYLDFVAKFYEEGTGSRSRGYKRNTKGQPTKRRSGGCRKNIGRVKEKHFFKRAQEKVERQIFVELTEIYENELQKEVSKRLK